MSKRSAALVGAAGMKDRKRGLSHETTAVASLSTNSRMTSAASFPSGRIRPVEHGDQTRRLAAEVQRYRVECQTLLAVGHHQVGHGLVVVEHPRRRHAAAPPGRRRLPTVPAVSRQASSAREATSCTATPVAGGDQRDVVELGLGPPAADLHAHHHAIHA